MYINGIPDRKTLLQQIETLKELHRKYTQQLLDSSDPEETRKLKLKLKDVNIRLQATICQVQLIEKTTPNEIRRAMGLDPLEKEGEL